MYIVEGRNFPFIYMCNMGHNDIIREGLAKEGKKLAIRGMIALAWVTSVIFLLIHLN